MPVRWAGRALSLPVPLLVSWNAYAPFSVPLLARDCAVDAAGALLEAAKAAGAHGLLLQNIATGGPAYAAILSALERRGLTPVLMRSFQRAGLDASKDAGCCSARSAVGQEAEGIAPPASPAGR